MRRVLGYCQARIVMVYYTRINRLIIYVNARFHAHAEKNGVKI